MTSILRVAYLHSNNIDVVRRVRKSKPILQLLKLRRGVAHIPSANPQTHRDKGRDLCRNRAGGEAGGKGKDGQRHQWLRNAEGQAAAEHIFKNVLASWGGGSGQGVAHSKSDGEIVRSTLHTCSGAAISSSIARSVESHAAAR
eukprot:scaffold67516_cov28-Tisochrysis_lutea.AAC.1